MASTVKTLVATGASSGIGLELIRQIIAQPTPWTIHLGARAPSALTTTLSPPANPSTTIFPHPLDLRSLSSVRTFAETTLAALGPTKLDYLLLNAGTMGGEPTPPTPGARYSDAYVVNHLAQHYLVHLLREKLVASGTRVVFVSSGAVRNAGDLAELDEAVRAGSKTSVGEVWKHYSQTKFIALLGAHWWRRELLGKCVVVAVSPGLVPNTGLGRSVGDGMKLTMDMPDAKSVPEGAESVYRAFVRDDIPLDPEQLFLTSWGEWWAKDVYGASLDRALWDKWCPSREQIEQEAGL